MPDTVRAPADTIGAALPSEVREALRVPLASWIAIWQAEVPGFGLDSLELASDEPFRVRYQSRYDSTENRQDLRRRYLAAYSPDRTRFVDPMSGFEIWKDSTGVRGGFDVDTSVLLVDLVRGLRTTVLFCGTPCTFERAVWLDDRRFAVTGRSELQSEPYRGGATLHVVDLGARRVRAYHGPPVEGPVMGRIARAMERDLRRRIPGLRL